MLSADRLSVPLWQQLAALLRNKIYNGFYPSGTTFPGEARLAQEFGVSRITVRRALEELAAQGLIVRRQGKATLVAPNLEPRPQAATGFVEDLISLFQATQLTESQVEERPAPQHVQEFLGIPTVVHIRRIRHRKGHPFSVSDSYLPPELGSKLTPDDLLTLQILELLEFKLDAPVQEAEHHIRALGAPEDVARLMGLTSGSPVMCLELMYWTDDMRPVACSRVHIAGDQYTYRTRLYRRTSPRGGRTHDVSPPAP